MKIIGLTGGIGSGKSTVLAEFSRLGAEVISCDEISHRIMKSGETAYNEVVSVFGTEILNAGGEIDRRVLADIVFSDNQKLKKLNKISHKHIYNEVKRLISVSDKEVVCVEIPLLFTAECPINLDLTVAVTAQTETRIKRTVARDGITRAQVEARIAKQMPDTELKRRADCVISNDSDLEHLRQCVKDIYNKFR